MFLNFENDEEYNKASFSIALISGLIPFLQVLRSDTEEKLVSDNGDMLPKTSAVNWSQSNFETSIPSYYSGLLLFAAAASTVAVGLFMKSFQGN